MKRRDVFLLTLSKSCGNKGAWIVSNVSHETSNKSCSHFKILMIFRLMKVAITITMIKQMITIADTSTTTMNNDDDDDDDVDDDDSDNEIPDNCLE